MKKLLSLIALMGFMQMNAQSIEKQTTRSGVYYAVKLNVRSVYHDLDLPPNNYGIYSLSYESTSEGSAGISLSMGYHVTSKFDVGMALGYDEYFGAIEYATNITLYYYYLELRSMPLTAQFKYNFSERKSSWYLSGDIGTQLDWSGKWTSGAVTAAGFGKYIPISPNVVLDASIVFDYRTVTNLTNLDNNIYSLGFFFGVSF